MNTRRRRKERSRRGIQYKLRRKESRRREENIMSRMRRRNENE